jgi:hypothetical protein
MAAAVDEAAMQVELQADPVREAGDNADPDRDVHFEPTSWIFEGSGARDSVRSQDDEDDSPNERLSRLSSSKFPVATEEEVEAQMAESQNADKQANVTRPPNYIKIGTRLPFRVPRMPEDLTPKWLTTALRFKKILPEDATVDHVDWRPIGEGGGCASRALRVCARLFVCGLVATAAAPLRRRSHST